MESRTPSKWNPQIYQTACDWFVEFRTGEPSDAARRSFLAWLQESPAHMGAYLEVTALWNESEAVDGVKEKWPLEALVEQARMEPDNIVPLAPLSVVEPRGEVRVASAISRSPHARRMARRWSVRHVAFAAVLLLMFSSMLTWLYLQRDTYGTGIGEQRLLTLADGSTVQLNARSQLRIRFSEHERKVELIRGQALFEVAKNPDRPFIVTSDGTRVRAVGTQFDVYKKNSGVVVTVVEGRVVVIPESSRAALARSAQSSDSADTRAESQVAAGAGPGSEARVLLSAGEQLTVTPKVVRKHEHANVAGATAWTQRQLVFESTPLADVVEEFNRYNERQLVIRDPALNEFQIDGVFSSTAPASLIKFLRSRPEIRVIERDAEIVIEKTNLP